MLASLRGTNLCQTLHFVFYTVLFFDVSLCKIMLQILEAENVKIIGKGVCGL